MYKKRAGYIDSWKFAHELKKLRQKHNLSQAGLSKLSGVSRSRIAAIESFEQITMKETDAHKIMKAFQ